MASYTFEFGIPPDFPAGTVRSRLERVFVDPAGKIRKFEGPDSGGFYRATVTTPYRTFGELETQVRYYVAGPMTTVREVEGGMMGEDIVTGVVAVVVGWGLWMAFRSKAPFLRDQG